MNGLTPDDLVPLDEFAGRRREFFEAHARYLDRYRRVRVGPRATLVFENRQTLWFRVQEVLRVARLNEPVRVRRELDVYNRLLPGRDCLQAALILAVEDENLYTSRPEDRCGGTAHWIQFVLDGAARRALAERGRTTYFSFALPAYRHDSAPLTDEVRQSLLEDLRLSDRDAA
jgi:hypothetical protein